MAWLGLVTALALGLFLTVVMRPARAAGPTPLLPDIVADPPNNVSLETSLTEGGLKGAGEPKLLLRFNGYIHNIGPGALEFDGSRNSPSEPMKAFQRIYNTDGSSKNEPSSAELIYVTADGHEHWHLQRVAKYSLWNSAKSAEVAPAQKVGFCLDDSEHVEPSVGPPEAVYSDARERKFCRQHEPEATSLFEGVSAGWRDLYRSNLAFQWVDASNVLPGEYWLRVDVNPTGVIKEAGGANAPAYATAPTIIPGFDALAQSTSTRAGEPKTLTLTSSTWNDSATPKYAIAAAPVHGTLSISGNQATYTPAAGYSGSDSFTFSSSDPNSPFPLHPAVATVAIEVTAGQPPAAGAPPPAPSVTIGGVPSSMTAGTRVQLSASVTNDSPGVTWSASAGSITSRGLYTAPSEPPAGGAVVVSARSAKGAHGQGTIAILGVFRPKATRIGRKLIMTTRVTKAGRVRLSAYLGKRRLGTCATRIRANRTFTCRLTLERRVSLHARISIWATLRVGRLTLRSLRPAAPVAIIKLKSPRKFRSHGHGSRLSKFVDGLPIASSGSSAPAFRYTALDVFSFSPAGPLLRTYRPRALASIKIAEPPRQAMLAIAGAPSSVIAGTSVQLSAVVSNDSSSAIWSASAGSITSGGLYTAPPEPPAGDAVVVSATTTKRAHDQRTIRILPLPTGEPAPVAPLPELQPPPAPLPARRGSSRLAPSGQGLILGDRSSFSPGPSGPQAMLVGGKLITTTRAGEAGRVRLSAYLGRHRLGSCVVETPAYRSFTCRLDLGAVSRHASISVWASLRVGGNILWSLRPAAPVPRMKMARASRLLRNGYGSPAWQFTCGPSMRS